MFIFLSILESQENTAEPIIYVLVCPRLLKDLLKYSKRSCFKSVCTDICPNRAQLLKTIALQTVSYSTLGKSSEVVQHPSGSWLAVCALSLAGLSARKESSFWHK